MSDENDLSISSAVNRYGNVFEELDDIIIIVDKKGLIMYVNGALRRKFGFKKKKFTGQNIYDCFPFDKNISKEEIIKKLYSKKDFVTHIELNEIESLHLSWKTKPFRDNNEEFVLAIIRDVTPQILLQKSAEEYSINLQEMVFKRTQQLEKEKQKAVELHQAKAIFLSKMSHEFRTPLTAIRGCVEMLQDPDLNLEERNKCLSVIDRNANSLQTMINDTLNMIKIEQDKYVINEKLFEILPLIKGIVETCTVLAEKKGLIMKYEIKEDVPEYLFSDPIALNQILTNLLGNAIKYSQEGKIILRIKQRYFPKTLTKKLYFYIEDNGTGIPKEHHRRIFRSFEQYLDNQMVHTRGSGLGLAISKQLAKLMGGNLKLLSSRVDVGSTFVFSLPIRDRNSWIT